MLFHALVLKLSRVHRCQSDAVGLAADALLMPEVQVRAAVSLISNRVITSMH